MMAHHRIRRGPDPADPFIVLEGIVAVVGLDTALLLPPGTVWPGQGTLPPALISDLVLTETQLSTGARTAPWRVTPWDIEVATALITAQLLRTGTIDQRLDRLAAVCDVTRQAVETTGHVIGAARASVAKHMVRRRAAR